MRRYRLSVIGQQAAAYDAIQEELRKAQDKIDNGLRSFARHPFIEIDRLLERIKSIFTEIEKELNDLKQEHPDLLDGDHIRDAVTALLEGKVGSPYSSERMDEIYKEGKTRYEHDIPPGYLDKDKGGTRQYGDLVLWFQIIDKAKETKKPIIFITDDRKDDWWWRFRGETIGPKPELVEEIVSKADVSFYMYQADRFMEHAQEYLEQQVKQEAIDEVRDVRRRDEEYMKVVQVVALRLPHETLGAMREAAAAIAASQIPYETLRKMSETAAAIAASQIPYETLGTMREAAAAIAASQIPYETLRKVSETAAAIAASQISHETLRQMSEAAAAAALRLPEETTESTTKGGGIPLDSEPEEEPDKSDEQPETGDE